MDRACESLITSAVVLTSIADTSISNSNTVTRAMPCSFRARIHFSSNEARYRPGSPRKLHLRRKIEVASQLQASQRDLRGHITPEEAARLLQRQVRTHGQADVGLIEIRLGKAFRRHADELYAVALVPVDVVGHLQIAAAVADLDRFLVVTLPHQIRDAFDRVDVVGDQRHTPQGATRGFDLFRGSARGAELIEADGLRAAGEDVLV